MILSFRHKGLAELWERGTSNRVDARMQKRIMRRLEALDAAEVVGDLNIPGFDFHPLQGKPQRYSLHVNGPWAITFEFEEGKALRVDYEQYH
jgi:proteic killer suppression protein